MSSPVRLALLEHETLQARDELKKHAVALEELDDRMTDLVVKLTALAVRLGIYAAVGALIGGALVAAIATALVRVLWPS